MAKLIMLAIITICLLSPSAFSQDKSAPSVENNLYVRALFACLEANAKAYSKQTNSRHDYYNVIVQKDDLTNGFPTQLGTYRIEYLDAQELAEGYKAKKVEFPIIVIRPIKSEGAKLVISFSDYFISFGTKTVFQALEGGCNVSLHYDCETKGYIVEKADLWGV